MDEVAEDQVRQASFQGAAGLGGGLVLCDLAAVEVLFGAGAAGLADGDDVDRGIELSVTQPAQAVPSVLAAGGVKGCGAVVAGVVVAGGEAADVAAVTENLRGDDRPDPADLGERGDV